uniref:Uncharacterized protein n=1 Tax=Myoviridae sp. ctool15 TaxID=2826696 RepID=A0A8S5QYJ7_9CAUD|nr:MAG TPA: hypothetical protein [Myoviridae sp. ctool15]
MGLMTASSGLTKRKLALATATPDKVSADATYYAGDKTLKTGTLVERGTNQNAGDIGAGGSGSSAYIAFNKIPEGIYRANGAEWGPEIRASSVDVMNQALKPTSAGNYRDDGNTNSSTSLSHSFSLTAGCFYLFVLDVGTRDGSSINASLSTPNCTNLLNLSYSDTQDKAYYDSRLIVRIVRCNSNTTATASVNANNIRSAGRIFCYKLSNW